MVLMFGFSDGGAARADPIRRQFYHVKISKIQPRRRKLGIGVLNILVSKIRLQCPRVVCRVGGRIAAGVPNTWMYPESDPAF
jgi:hypothetical protein